MKDAVILPAPGPHTATVVWLHGLGADGNDFVPVVPELGLPAQHGVKFIFPHASVRPVTINNGHPMRAWYDILTLTRLDKQDEAGTAESAARISNIIRSEMAAGIASTRIILAGFSQGCAMTLHTGLRFEAPLGGLVALSGYLPMHLKLAEQAHAANQATPIFMAHGSYDNVVPYALGDGSREILQAQGYSVAFTSYPMQHSVCAEEIEAIGGFIRQRLAL